MNVERAAVVDGGPVGVVGAAKVSCKVGKVVLKSRSR